ncbi:alpha-hydroxy-acid oxidizing enzyme [Longibacter salinarum]|uniref:Alpha-hydroxy-acid oxidizing enzyme n=1 Tax=Longibacter salinarum TaxID=1850348 RepID=A0A2A8D2K5_9BACT|nr:lactate 2-monooxygenase [Longibacter salinarum]PEN15185.1 alpha-hydroxy-acid oxidizing enzyme [Longibacter salinarum]
MSDRVSSSSVGMERQIEIYMNGLQGKAPDLPVDPDRLRIAAREVLDDRAWGYLDGGAGSGDTMSANRAAFRRWRLRPRMLQGVEDRDLHVQVLGSTIRAPMMFAPIGVLSIIHPAAEVAVAEAASTLNLPLVLSTAASRSMEEVADAQGDGARWFQLYWGKNDDVTASMVERAEASGYSAIVVTLDTTVLSWRDRDLENGYLPFLEGEGLGNYFSDPAFRRALDEPPEENPTQAILYFASMFSNPALTWDDLQWLRDLTDLPIVLKGILDPQDAKRAAEARVDGIIVSNHGGRQVDGAIAALDALPVVADAVGDQIEVFFDSGIRRGSDILKALALGARAVLVGRPYCHGLAIAGADGASEMMLNLLSDLDLTLGLTGCSSIDDVTRDLLLRADAEGGVEI